MKKEKYLAPAVFSALVIGLGQIIKGDSKKGLKWILFFYFFLPMLTYASLIIHGYPFLFLVAVEVVLYPAFWAYNIHDAYTRVQR